MNKLVISLVASAFALVAAPASYAGPICVDFLSFCDGLEVTINADHTISGSWVNTDCAGAEVPVVGGVTTPNTFRVLCTTGACPNGIMWMFVLTHDVGVTGLFNMFGTDGINPPFPQQLNQPYRASNGECAFNESEKGNTPSKGM